MRNSNNNSAPEIDYDKSQLPAIIEKNKKTVERAFWKKFTRVASFIPFSHDVLAAYFCSIDPTTPTRVRGILLAALAYFIMPADLVPDFIVGLGFSDDATVITAAIGIVSGHISDEHRAKATKTLQISDSTPADK